MAHGSQNAFGRVRIRLNGASVNFFLFLLPQIEKKDALGCEPKSLTRLMKKEDREQ